MMALIDSPRLTAGDREAWLQHAHRDRRMLTLRSVRERIARRTADATERIGRFAEDGPCAVATSWGRDSVVIAHLAHPFGLPLAHITHGDRPDRINNPDAAVVRDAFLARWPATAGYTEYPIEVPRARQAWERDHPRRITGIRADESATRTLSLITHGVATDRSCRPIIDWTSQDVWLYAAHHDLPLHPAYAMSYGGVLSRDHLRVASLGGERGRGVGRAEWESTYYPEVRSLKEDRWQSSPA